MEKQVEELIQKEKILREHISYLRIKLEKSEHEIEKLKKIKNTEMPIFKNICLN